MQASKGFVTVWQMMVIRGMRVFADEVVVGGDDAFVVPHLHNRLHNHLIRNQIIIVIITGTVNIANYE